MEKNLTRTANDSNAQKYLVLPIWIMAVLALGMVMHVAADIFLWFVASFFLFTLLDPALQSLKRRKVSNLVSALILIVVAIFICLIVLGLLIHFSTNIFLELEESKRIFLKYYQSALSKVTSWKNGFSHSTAPAAPLDPALAPKPIPKVEVVQSSPFGGELGSTVMHGLGSAFTVLTFAFLWPILTFFMLIERSSMSKVIPLAYRDPATSKKVWAKIVAATRAFFLGNLVLAVVTYPIFVALFLIFGIGSALTLAALASVFNLIPFLGAVLSGFLPALAMLSQSASIGATLGLYGACVLIHFSVANFVTPKVLGSKVDINATTSTISLIVWGELWGGIGLLLAIPLTAVIKILMENSNLYWLEWMAALMSEKAVKLADRDSV